MPGYKPLEEMLDAPTTKTWVFQKHTKLYLFKRRLKHWWQKRTRGWSDEDTWGLDHVIAKFVLPRLKRFKELNNGFPEGFNEKTWNIAIDEMIYALEVCSRDDYFGDDIEWERVELGLRLFGKHFRDLWW